MDGEGIGADRGNAYVDVGAGDDREDNTDIAVVDEIGLSVGGDESILRRLGEIGENLNPVIGLVDVIGDAGDEIDEELVGVGEANCDGVVAAVVEGEGDAVDCVGE